MSNENNSHFSDADVLYVRGRYEARIAQAGVTVETLHSGGLDKDRVRYEVHATALKGREASVLDIGCGLAGFYDHILSKGYTGAYRGVDIVPAYVAFCRNAHPGATFAIENPLGVGIGGEYDSIVMCQTLNTRLPASNNMDVLAMALEQAFSHSRHSVSFDMLSSYVDFQEDHLFYYAPEQVFALAKKLTRWVVLRHDYRPYEFCIQMYRGPQSAEQGWMV